MKFHIPNPKKINFLKVLVKQFSAICVCETLMPQRQKSQNWPWPWLTNLASNRDYLHFDVDKFTKFKVYGIKHSPVIGFNML